MLGRLTTWQVIVSAKASSSCSAARFIFAQFLSFKTLRMRSKAQHEISETRIHLEK